MVEVKPFDIKKDYRLAAMFGKIHDDTVKYGGNENKGDMDMLQSTFTDGELPQIRAVTIFHDNE